MVNGDGDDDGDLLTRTIRIRALWHICGLSVYTHQYVCTSYELFVYTHRVIVASDGLASLHNDYWSNHMPDISDMTTIRHSDMLLYQKTAKLKGRGRKIRWHIIYKHFVYVTYYTHTNMLYMLHITRIQTCCTCYILHVIGWSHTVWWKGSAGRIWTKHTTTVSRSVCFRSGSGTNTMNWSTW